MIRFSNGTVFNANTDAIVNTVNCDGVMGAGIALEFGLRYPDMYDSYKTKCELNEMRIGKVDYYTSNEITIVNFPTKHHFKYPSRIEWIESGLRDFVNSYNQYQFRSIAFPKLGAGKGSLEWGQVLPVMEKYLEPLDIECVICLDTITYAEGVEKRMVDRINSDAPEQIVQSVKLSKDRLNSIIENRPFTRFFEISRIKGLGKKTYAKLFNHYYKAVAKESEYGEQLRLEL